MFYLHFYFHMDCLSRQQRWNHQWIAAGFTPVATVLVRDEYMMVQCCGY